jgi:hypothetical protein
MTADPASAWPTSTREPQQPRRQVRAIEGGRSVTVYPWRIQRVCLSGVAVTFLQPLEAATLLGSVSLLSEYFLPRTWPRSGGVFSFWSLDFDIVPDGIRRAFRRKAASRDLQDPGQVLRPKWAASGEFDADLFLLPPDHLARAGRFTVVEDQIECVGDTDRIVDHQAGTRVRQVSDQTGNDGPPAPESDPGGFVGPVPSGSSYFVHGDAQYISDWLSIY